MHDHHTAYMQKERDRGKERAREAALEGRPSGAGEAGVVSLQSEEHRQPSAIWQQKSDRGLLSLPCSCRRNWPAHNLTLYSWPSLL